MCGVGLNMLHKKLSFLLYAALLWVKCSIYVGKQVTPVSLHRGVIAVKICIGILSKYAALL